MARNRIIPIFVSHIGCKHQCVFCNQHNINGSKDRITGDKAAEIIRDGLAKSGNDVEVAFYGGSFTCVPEEYQKELLSAVKPWRTTGEVKGIRVSTRPDAVGEKEAEFLKSYGVTTVELGCQSMDEYVLRESGRGHSSEDVYRAVASLKTSELQVILQMMTGLPGSTPASDMETGKTLAQLDPDGVRIYPTIVVPGTELYQRWQAGAYQPQPLEAAVELCASLGSMFGERGIPVLRYGLQPTDELSNGRAAAGPYHPAFGELVKSRMMLRRAEKLVQDTKCDEIILTAHPKDISILIGQNRCNEAALKQQFPRKKIRIIREDSSFLKACLKSTVITVKI